MGTIYLDVSINQFISKKVNVRENLATVFHFVIKFTQNFNLNIHYANLKMSIINVFRFKENNPLKAEKNA